MTGDPAVWTTQQPYIVQTKGGKDKGNTTYVVEHDEQATEYSKALQWCHRADSCCEEGYSGSYLETKEELLIEVSM
jgi:hypothetical protein